jgi:hypothetical protein
MARVDTDEKWQAPGFGCGTPLMMSGKRPWAEVAEKVSDGGESSFEERNAAESGWAKLFFSTPTS